MENKVIDFEKEVECCDLNHEGVGVCKVDNIVFFTPNLLTGEKAIIKGLKKKNTNYGNGKVVKRLTNAPFRVYPICNNFYQCGGCDLMHMNYESQLEFKLKMVNETLKRIGNLDFTIDNIIGASNPLYYRNKVQIPFQKKGDKVICGFYQKKTHKITQLKKCFIQDDLMSAICISFRDILQDRNVSIYDEDSNKGLFRHLLIRKTTNKEYMVVFIINQDKTKKESELLSLFKGLAILLQKKHKEIKSIILNINKNTNNVILGDKYYPLIGGDYLVEDILGLKFMMSHKAFFQINHDQTEKLYSKVLEFADVDNTKTVVDCYCGVGTISLLCARKAKKVIGIEVVSEAIENAKRNAKLNEITNASFVVGKSEEQLINYKNADVLIVDPPRKGMDHSIIKSIIDSSIERIIYVSCDCATMSRDLALMNSHYNIVDGAVIDLFPQTANVETVVLLTHKKYQG